MIEDLSSDPGQLVPVMPEADLVFYLSEFVDQVGIAVLPKRQDVPPFLHFQPEGMNVLLRQPWPAAQFLLEVKGRGHGIR